MSYDYTPNNTKLDALIFSVSVEKFICFYLRSLFCQIFLLPKHSVDVIWNSRLMKATNGTQKSRSHKSAPNASLRKGWIVKVVLRSQQ